MGLDLISGRTSRLMLLVAGLVVIPTLVFAKCGGMSERTLDQVGWVLFGGLAVVVFEAGLIRRFIDITALESLQAAWVANLVAYFFGLVVGVFTIPLGHETMHRMAEAFWDIDGRVMDIWTRQTEFPMLSELTTEISATLFGAAFLAVFAALIKSPIYAAIIKRHFEPGYKLNALGIMFVNLISLPIFYTLLFIAGWFYAWLDHLGVVG